PGMYADLIIDHDMGEGLLIPESAVLRTGTRNLVFRVLPENHFEPVEVKIGSYEFNGRFEVLSGLSEGDKIVTSAGFLIDAESRLKSATSGMSGHQHGGSMGPEKKMTAPEPKAKEEKQPAMEHMEHMEHEHHEHH